MYVRIVVRAFLFLSFTLAFNRIVFCIYIYVCWMKVVCVDLSQAYTQTDRHAYTRFVSFSLRFPIHFLRFNSHSRSSVSMHNEFRAFLCVYVCMCVCLSHTKSIVLTLFAMTFYCIRFSFSKLYNSTQTRHTLSSIARLSYRVDTLYTRI